MARLVTPGHPLGCDTGGRDPAELMCLADPAHGEGKRETMVEHALEHASGAIVYHPLNNEAS